MPYIEPRVTSEGQTHYRVMVRLKGFPTQTATFRRKTDAVRWGQQTEVEIRAGRYFKTAEAKRHTLAELLERYAAEVVPLRKKRDRKEMTRQLDWWSERLGDYTLAEVSPALIARARNRLGRSSSRSGRPVTPATQNRYLQTLSHAFSIAVREWEWLEDNPVRRVRRLKEPRGRVRFLSEDERERLLDACRESRNPRLFLITLIAISTGARQGEMLALRWPDVDFERQSAVLHHTKNGERRAIPLTGPVLHELQRWSRVRRIDTDLVFASSKECATFPRKAWNAALKVAELDDFRFHDLRHTAASYLAMSGATLAEIAEILGHKTLQMVKRYAHLTESHTHSVVARMNARYL